MASHRIRFRIGIVLLALLALPFAAFGGTKAYRWAAYQAVGANGIVRTDAVPVRGIRHFLFIRGYDGTKPVLLFLPGGPGESVVPLGQEFTDDLQHDFVVAEVEFGVGKAEQYRETPSLDQFIDDAEALVDHLRSSFGGRPVYLVGHSLGSIQALRIAQRSPEKVAGIATVGQTVDWRAGNVLTANRLRALATRAGDRATVADLARLPATLATSDDPPMIDFASVKTQRDLLDRYGMETVLRKHTAKARWWTYLTAPTHSLADSCNLLYKEGGLCARIAASPNWWQQWHGIIPGVLQFNAPRDVPELKRPYLAIVGSNDWVCPADLTRAYVRGLRAPSKRLVVLNGAGHYAHLDQPRAFQAAIRAAFRPN